MLSKQRVFFLTLAVVATLLVVVFKDEQAGLDKPNNPAEKPTSASIPSDKPQLVSTKPDPLDEAYISAVSPIEMTFNIPIENWGEFKHNLSPETAKYKGKLSDDRKTVIITPEGSYPVGTTFTLKVSPETKFDGGKRMESDIIIHFKTIDYRGV